MPEDAVTLRAVYTRHDALAGEPPDRYVVTARGGALVADVPDEATARRFFLRWAALVEERAVP